jgi:UTP:GlnB (protein PII) uridylyltransferase
MTHYRFMEHFNDYVIPLSALEAFFAASRDGDFIEKSQILESRLIVGTAAFEEQYHERIIRRFIFADADRYIADMRAEMASRHASVGDVIPMTNLKECVGGLRDIVMTTLVYKARYGIRDPLTVNILEAIARLFPEAGVELRSLHNSLCFLKTLRDVYRLTICVDDDIDFDQADVVAEILGFEGDGTADRCARMRDAYARTTAKVAAEVRSLLAKV